MRFITEISIKIFHVLTRDTFAEMKFYVQQTSKAKAFKCAKNKKKSFRYQIHHIYKNKTLFKLIIL